MFAYCYNNPITYYDPTGENGLLVAASGVLVLADGSFPIGDILALILIKYSIDSCLEEREGHIQIESIPTESPEISVESMPTESPAISVESMPTESPSIPIEYIPTNIPQVYVEGLSIIVKQGTVFYKGGKRNVKHTKYRTLSNEQVIELYKNPLSKKEKKDLFYGEIQ